MDPDFLTASSLDKSKYAGVTLGRKQGEIMKELVYKHGFFRRKESFDFQGSCRLTPEAPKVITFWIFITDRVRVKSG